jgi:hypothetical protein
MKRRYGFVSNSSSSSFLLIGFSADETEADEHLSESELQKKYPDLEIVCTVVNGNEYDDWKIGVVLTDKERDWDHLNPVTITAELFQRIQQVSSMIAEKYGKVCKLFPMIHDAH